MLLFGHSKILLSLPREAHRLLFCGIYENNQVFFSQQATDNSVAERTENGN